MGLLPGRLFQDYRRDYTVFLPQRVDEDCEDLRGLAFAAAHQATGTDLGLGRHATCTDFASGRCAVTIVNIGVWNIGVWGLFKLGGLCPGICLCLRTHVHEGRAHIWIYSEYK